MEAQPQDPERVDAKQTVFVVDDEPAIREAMALLLQSEGCHVETFDRAETFLRQCTPDRPGCLLLDIALPGMSGLALQQRLHAEGYSLPVIFMTGHGQVPEAVRAIKAGAVEFLLKPVNDRALLRQVHEALQLDREQREQHSRQARYRACLARLTRREREIMTLLVKGFGNKEIARLLDISPRTVESHRAHIMRKTGAESLPNLVALAVAGDQVDPDW